MLRVFLAEDESIIRETLRDTVPWAQCGYTFAGEAGDGEMALPLIRQLKPDVLITDIRMPFMDGLALSELVRREFPEMKIIIISGYDDFEYARQAISIGVDQYLLKPITKKALLEHFLKYPECILLRWNPTTYAVLLKGETARMEELAILLGVMQSANVQEIPSFTDEYIHGVEEALGAKPFCQYLMLSVRFTADRFAASLVVGRQEAFAPLTCLDLGGGTCRRQWDIRAPIISASCLKRPRAARPGITGEESAHKPPGFHPALDAPHGGGVLRLHGGGNSAGAAPVHRIDRAAGPLQRPAEPVRHPAGGGPEPPGGGRHRRRPDGPGAGPLGDL